MLIPSPVTVADVTREAKGRSDDLLTALPEVVRSLMALAVVAGGLVAIHHVAVTRSIDDAARLSGILAGLMGAVVTYYFTRGLAESAERRAVEEATARARLQAGADTMAAEMRTKTRQAQEGLEQARQERMEYLLLLARARSDPVLRQKIQEVLGEVDGWHGLD